MNFFQKRFLTLAAFIANISLTLVVAGVATFAWFQENINVNVDVMSSNVSIESAGPNAGLSYEVLKYDDNIKAGRSYTGSEAVAQFKLPFYDTYITERNQYANVLLRAEVTTSVDTSTEEFTIDITRLASSFKTAGVIGSKTSNVIQFKSTVYKYKVSGAESYTVNTSSHNSIDETSAATKYATASSYFASKKTPTTFVPIRDNSDGTVIVNRKAEADTITLIPDLPSGLVLESAIIYIECTYHDTLVSEFVKSHSESELSHSLDGDISLIKFGKQTKTANASHATGKYIKVESEVTASSGQYLPTYDAGSGVGKILKGSLNTGIDVNNNLRQVELNAATATEPMSIDSTDTIDDEAFTYDRTAKTLKTKGGYYIGNNLAAGNYSITTSQDPTNLTNEISFDNGHPVITSKSGKFLQHYSSGSSTDRIRYYAASHPLDLYRYTENVAEMPTLVSIAITQTPTSEERTFYTNHTFNLNGLEVTATYSDSSTAVVTHSCTFTSPNGVRTLVPEGRTGATSFSTAQANKTVNISYSEGAVTLTNAASYTINIVDEAITSLSKEGSLSTTYYYVGDTFSSAGVTIYGEYNSGITHANVTSSCTFDGYNMSSAGTYTVKANYDGLSVNVGTIYVRAKALSITPTSKTLAEGETFTITVTYNVPVTVSVTNGTGSVTSNKSSISYSQANKLTTTTTVTITAVSAGTATVSFSGTGVSTVSCAVTVTATPTDHFSIGAGSIVSGTSYQAHTANVSMDYNGTGSASRGWVITHGGNNSSLGTNSGHRSSCNLGSYTKYAVSPVTTSVVASAFASTSKLYKISSIVFSYTGGSGPSSNVYAIYSTDNSTFTQVPLSGSSTFSQGGTMNTTGTEYKFTFDKAYTGYFALVFKATNSSGDWRIDGLTLQFNPVTLSSISISGDCSTKTYNNGDSLNMSGLSVIANYSDGSTSDVTASATLTPATNPLTTGTTSVVVNASYTDAKGVNKTASKTITGLTVNAVKVNSITLNQSTATISVGSTVQLSVTAIGPANADNKNYTWSVYSGGSYATVNSSGLVTGSAAGTAVIRATANDGGGAYAACTVTVTASKTLSSITISGQTTTFTQGSTFAFGGTVTAHYSDSTTANVTTSATFSGYNMSNTGSQTVTVSYTEGGVTKTATYNITVNVATKTYTLTISYSDFTTVSYANNDGSHSKNATATDSSTMSVSYTTSNVYQNSSKMQFKSNSGQLYNTTDLGRITKITLATSTNFTIYVSTTSHPTSGTTVTSGSTISGTYKYFTIKAGSSTPKTATITITFVK